MVYKVIYSAYIVQKQILNCTIVYIDCLPCVIMVNRYVQDCDEALVCGDIQNHAQIHPLKYLYSEIEFGFMILYTSTKNFSYSSPILMYDKQPM